MLPVIDGQTQLVIPIPGAPSLVRDIIRIESRQILNEKQTLQIEQSRCKFHFTRVLRGGMVLGRLGVRRTRCLGTPRHHHIRHLRSIHIYRHNHIQCIRCHLGNHYQRHIHLF